MHVHPDNNEGNTMNCSTNRLMSIICSSRRFRLSAFILSICAVLLSFGAPATAGPVVPRTTVVFGGSYGDWAAQWWQWILSIPAASNPGLDTDGSFCAEGQSGPVWFLAGTFDSSTVERNCTVPAGKRLFFPILTGLFGSGVFDCAPSVADVVCNLSALRASASSAVKMVSMQLYLDGERIGGLRLQRAMSPSFEITLPEANLLDLGAGTYQPQVTDGYWIMLKALPAGNHTIVFSGEFLGGPFQGTTLDITYNLTVE